MKRVWILTAIIFVGALLIGCGGGDDSLSADAGEDFEIQIGQPPNFDGCKSSGEISNYRWTIVEAPDKMVGDNGKVIREIDPNCAFTLDAAMGVDEVGSWVIELEVSSTAGETATDRVTVTVNE